MQQLKISRFNFGVDFIEKQLLIQICDTQQIR